LLNRQRKHGLFQRRLLYETSVTSYGRMECLYLWMGVILETIFRSMLLMQKKSTNGLHKRLSTKRSLTPEGMPITDNHKQHSKLRKKLRNKLRNKLRKKLRPYKLCPHKLRLHKLRLYKLRLDKLYPHKLRPYKLRPASKLDKNLRSKNLRKNFHR
jgi:hypothetical protein